MAKRERRGKERDKDQEREELDERVVHLARTARADLQHVNHQQFRIRI